MRWWISVAFCACAAGGPIDFGLAEYNAALAARNLKWKVNYELSLEPAETFRIEPYKYGGAHITGGDMRGLMYGLLEAAEQIRTTGRLKQAHGIPTTATRGVRMFVRGSTEVEAGEVWWRSYFQTLARDRFNRFTLVLLDAPAEAQLTHLREISQAAADYALDFTLGIWSRDAGPLRKIVAACPAIRTIQVRNDSDDIETFRGTVLKPLRDAGRRVALAPLGTFGQAEFLKAAESSGVALQREFEGWPEGFEIDPPKDSGDHAMFYWIWGRLGYDPKTKPPQSASPEEIRALVQVTSQIAAAQAVDPAIYTWPGAGPAIAASKNVLGNEWVASIQEAVRDRLERVASAKRTPIEIADSLSAASPPLDKSALPDFQLLGKLARYHAEELRAAYELELFDRTKDPDALERSEADAKRAQSIFDSARGAVERVAQHRNASDASPVREIPSPAKLLARPQIGHAPVKTAAPDTMIVLKLDIAQSKDVRLVRLHFRTWDSAPWQIVEKPAGAEMVFQVQAGVTDVTYYFEILNRENTGWFEPDPILATPYHVVRIEPK